MKKQSEAIFPKALVREFHSRWRLVHDCVSKSRPKLKIRHVAARSDVKHGADLGFPTRHIANHHRVSSAIRRQASGESDGVGARNTAVYGGKSPYPEVAGRVRQ